MSLIVTKWDCFSVVGDYEFVIAHLNALSAAGFECKGITSTMNGKVDLDGDMVGNEFVAFYQRPVSFVSNEGNFNGVELKYEDYVAPH
jgi:hypothetical protein